MNDQDLALEVGQRLIVNFDGPELTTEAARLIVDCRAGGVILFSNNIESLPQVLNLNRNLQQLAVENNLPPLIISIDEEGGRVSRMPPDGFDLTMPSQMAQAASGLEAAGICAASTARRLRLLGFNLNYAPVLDVNNNPANPVIGTRSFGSSSELAAKLGENAVKGYLSENFASCVKHFPGHGDTAVDSHIGLPVVSKSLEQLWQTELVPFQRVVNAGVPAVMTAHIVYPDLEPENLPATLSSYFLGEMGLLRRELKFNGLIFTDALRMQAISDRYGLGEASLMALRAGADIVMPMGMLETQLECYKVMVGAARRGDYNIEESSVRITAFKERFCRLHEQLDETHWQERLLLEADIAAEEARRSITLLQSQSGGLLPLLSGKFRHPILVDFEVGRLSQVEEKRVKKAVTLFELLKSDLPQLTHEIIAPDFDDEEGRKLLQTASAGDALIILCRSASRFDQQLNLVKSLIKLGLPAAVIAAREPYELAQFEGVDRIACYAEPLCSVRALAGVLTGKIDAKGKLPVNLS